MDFKQQTKLFKRAAARNSMLFFTWLLEVLPFPLVKAIFVVSSKIAFRLTVRLRKISRETLTIALGQEKSPQEIEQIINGCFSTLARGMLDVLFYSRYPDRVREKYHLRGKEHLDAALAKGRGVMAVTAHFGNFPCMMLALAQYGYKVNVIMRRARDEKVGEFVLKTMDRVNVHTIYSRPQRQCVTESLRVLRNNEILFILLDQNFGASGGVFVDFFGQQAATATGPIVLAARSGAAVVPVFNFSVDTKNQTIQVEPELELEKKDNSDETLLANVSRITKIIEGYIRRHPTEWGWMHRRFKSQAPGASKEKGSSG